MLANEMNRNESEEANPSALRRLFEDSAIAKLLDFLTLYRDFDYSKVEISRNSGVSWKTMYRLWPLLEKYNLVVKTRQVGRATLYKLNTDNPIARALHDLTLQISVYDAEKIVQEELNEEELTKKETIKVTTPTT